MAATSPATDANPPPSPSPTPRVNLRNPTPLSATQEAEVRDLYYKRVRRLCAPEVKAFAACAVNRTVTATWVCRKERLSMNSCMIAQATPENEDRAREEWFSGYAARRQAREEEERGVERRRKEVIDMMKKDEEERTKQSAGGWWWKKS